MTNPIEPRIIDLVRDYADSLGHRAPLSEMACAAWWRWYGADGWMRDADGHRAAFRWVMDEVPVYG